MQFKMLFLHRREGLEYIHYNLGNLLDDENGQIYDAGYLGVTKSLDVVVNADNTYTYSNFDDGHLRYRNGSRFVSVYKAMVGFKLSF